MVALDMQGICSRAAGCSAHGHSAGELRGTSQPFAGTAGARRASPGSQPELVR